MTEQEIKQLIADEISKNLVFKNNTDGYVCVYYDGEYLRDFKVGEVND